MKESPIGTVWLLFAFDGTVLPQRFQYNTFCVQKWNKKEACYLFLKP